MKRILLFVKTTLIGGLFFIFPLALFIFLLLKIIEIFRRITAPIADKIDISFFGEETMARIIAVLILLLVCFIAGLVARRKKSSPVKDWIETNIFSNIPGYTLVKGMTERAAGFESKNLKEVVLVNIEEVWQVGFLMDRVDMDINVVFIPSAPNPMEGDVVLVKNERLKKLDIDEINVIKIYRKLGQDFRQILEGKIDKSIFD
ncbi:DUF502 domain-containing protein [Aequorivita sp. SDUM287046]|uniref:DUF502 domain-containing protein n=1 Tax=Aequorivita aurantiaca TaxID=3053356 RepID=A0ABT8DEH6_9FLAO|nr:DUF502 domain-containing protein [Aequorivita aurantiaca]MDN3723543.1 DUF502 domain-containing protein [Aequorivita aurantiaca]